MEPEGRPLTPGTSYGPPPFTSAQLIFSNCTFQSSCSPDARDGPMSAEGSRGRHACAEGPKQTEADPEGSTASRRFRSSAFPSSLSWDSDSERETLDEEELQHFANPHGLAAHSPGSPSSGLRLDSEDDQEPDKMQRVHSRTDSPSPGDGRPDQDQNQNQDQEQSTKPEEPNTSQLVPTELADNKVWSVSEGTELFLAKVKPKDGCQTEAEEEEEEDNGAADKTPKGKEGKESQRDVYSFPGDSEPESPPPAPWAHCTFIQRCRKKRVLLRPFSGLGALKPESGKRARASPEKIYDFEEVNFGEEATFDEIKLSGSDGKRDEEEEEEGKEIFTCVECSIYFRKQIHLQEHMVEHCEGGGGGGGGGRRSGKSGRFRCLECGWSLANRLALVDHHRRHEESRRKILEEIEKLNGNGTASKDSQQRAANVATSSSPDPSTEPDPDPVVSPPPQTPEAAATVLDSSPQTPAQARAAAACRRRFVCTKCGFNTRTSQALANHSKTHNRKKHALRSASPAPDSPPRAFVSPGPAALREHQKLVHPGTAEDPGQHGRPKTAARPLKNSSDPDRLVGSGSDTAPGKSQQGPSPAPEDGAQFSGQVAFKGPGNRRFRRRGKTWTHVGRFHRRLVQDKMSGSEEEEDEGGSTDLDFECPKEDLAPKPDQTRQTRARSSTDDQSATTPPPPKKSAKDDDKLELEKVGKVFFLRRSSRVSAAPAGTDSDDEDVDDDDEDVVDEERVRRFLSEGILDEDQDEDAEALKSVERKCPYCPDRFHNGIGLANHVRGHLNRVGVSYNVRHFISPEEVNAIEKKFSYQKKKKKVANFDPDTFSVMHCEFCSAGFDTRAGLSSHARAHLRDFGITNWDVTISPIHILRELFSSRPDLVLPTAPPRSPGSSLEEEEKEEEEEEEEVKEEDGERPVASPQSMKKEEDGVEEREGEEEEEEGAAEDVDELSGGEAGLCGGGSGGSGGGVDADSSAPKEDANPEVPKLKCDVCGAQFETRRGLSIHARSHLRQLGATAGGGGGDSSKSGVPSAELLLLRGVNSQIASPRLEPPSAKTSSPSLPPRKDEDLDDMDVDEKPIALSVLAKAAKAAPPPPLSSSSTPAPSPNASPAPPHSGSPSSVVRKAPISSLLPVSSPLRSPEHKATGMKSLMSNLSGPASIATTKPLWAPQENDAPLNLTLEVDPDKDIVCQLCGAWFETRKGLSSHARAHLRHFGVEYSESKGSPIDLLNQLIDTDDFKHKAGALQLDAAATEPRVLTAALPSPKQASLLSLASSASSPAAACATSSASVLYKVTPAGGGPTSKATSSSSSSSSSSSLLGPPAKRLKSSSMRVFRLSSGELMALPHSEPPKEIGCEFCGEFFENRKGLSSHARSHLRQMGITEWSVNGSPIDTLREIIARRGLPCALPLKPHKTPPPSSPGPPRSPLSTASSSSPSSSLLSRLPFAFARPSSPPQPAASKPSSAPPPPLPPPAAAAGLILKLKPEPVQLEVTTPGAVGRSDAGGGGFAGESLSWSGSDNALPLNLALAHDAEPTRDIRCEFCGEYFENRKGLSSHARSHLRQMGITEWSVNGSPIDTLREVMHKRGAGGSARSDHAVKKESGHGAGSPPWDSADGGAVAGYPAPRFRKSPLSLLQPGSRVNKQGVGSSVGGAAAAPPTGKFFRISPLGKRPLSEEAQSVESGQSPSHPLKTFSPLPHDFSYKRKPSPDKQGHQDPSCELCGFFFENRKALASHARAHLRQFGVTEWSVNGSPIETLSAWIRSKPQKVLEMHRSYMQGSRSTLKKKASSSSSTSSSSSSSTTQWSSSLAVSLVRPLSRDVGPGFSKTPEDGGGGGGGGGLSARPGRSSPGLSRLAGALPLQAQVARSELNVRLPRGFERRPLKHPSCPDGPERDSGTPKPARSGTVPALVPKPPSYPLVKLVGKFYTLKCRFCEVEFHGPLSVQEDWIRHLQQHILKTNYAKPPAPKVASAGSPAPADDDPPPAQASAPASTSTSSATSTPTRGVAPPNGCSSPPPARCDPPVTAREMVKASEERRTLSPAAIALPT